MPTNNDEGFSSPIELTEQNLRDLVGEKKAKMPTTKKYIGCKIIAAEPMSYEEFLRWKSLWREGQETLGDGYKVKYPDGYTSWSPKKTFDEAYREISESEYKLLSS